MSTDDLPARLVAVARALGCAATHDDPVADLDLSALPHLLAAEPEVFRAPITAVAYLQAPTGWRQRVRLSVLMRVDHPLSRLVPLTDAERDLGVVVPAAASMPRLPTGSALTELVGHLSDLARSGAPLVLEKAIADRLNLDALSPRMVSPHGVQRVRRQTLRVWNTLAVWMREDTESPRGGPSLLRDLAGHAPRGPSPAESAPILY